MDIWTDKRIDIHADRQTNRQTDRWTDKRIEKHEDRQTVGQMDRLADGQGGWGE